MTTLKYSASVTRQPRPLRTEIKRTTKTNVIRKLSTRGVYLGRDIVRGKKAFAPLSLFESHVQAIGPTGVGKTRWNLSVAEALYDVPGATVVVVTAKGDLCRMALDLAIANGHTKRVIWFDPADKNVPGFEPLYPNDNLAPSSQVKGVREGLRASQGLASFDETPRLARVLYLTLSVTRHLRMGLPDAVRLLRSGKAGSAFRQAALLILDDPYLSEALSWYESLSTKHQEEISESSLNKLENLIADPLIRRLFTNPTRLDFDEIVTAGKILLLNFEIGRPLRHDDVRIIVRLLLNCLLNAVYSRDPATRKRNPIFLILDEAQNFLSSDIISVLTMGRELGVHLIISHQDLSQLRQADPDGVTYSAVMGCARTKVIFGGLSFSDLEVLARETMLDGFDPWTVKDEIQHLEIEPVETVRAIVTDSETISDTKSEVKGKSLTRSDGESEGSSHSLGKGSAHSAAKLTSSAAALSSGQMRGQNSGLSNSYPILLSGALPNAITITNTQGSSAGESSGESEIAGQGTAASNSESNSESYGEHHSKSRALSVGVQVARGSARTLSQGRSATLVPFHELLKRYVVSSRQFLSQQEFLTLCQQKLHTQKQAQYFIKTVSGAAAFMEAAWMPDPWLPARQKDAAMQRIGAPYFITDENVLESVQTSSLFASSDSASELPGNAGEESAPRTKPKNTKTTAWKERLASL